MLEQLTIDERGFLVNKINKKINIPFLGEKFEALVILAAITYFEQILATDYKLSLKEVVYSLVGLQDTTVLLEKISELIEKVDIPFLRKKKVQKIFRIALLILAEATKERETIETANVEG